MENMKIVDYDHKYAKAIAKMWDESGDGWGGWNTVTTEESIIQQHEGSSNLNIYIAMDGEEAVGYCSFAEYAEDEGALYIPLLNARTDYHGKGVGKALVLKAVERTIALGWPRLDLYTWAGNTKAVPLYKKCGFFWERRDDTTHLINLIPTVLQTDAVKDHFERIDWYKDSIRDIKVEPDGYSENGFDYFEYIWKKDDINLRMQFERRGRGLRLIETDDYLIKATVEDLNLVFGKSYSIKYDILNKSGKPLDISIKGSDNKNIKYSFDKTFQVSDSLSTSAEFYVDVITEEQSEWKTHPTVNSEIMINGKKAVFKVGFVPKYPAKLSLEVPEDICFRNKDSFVYLDIENNFSQPAVYEFELANNDDISFGQTQFKVELEANERKSIEIPYGLKEFCFYKALTDFKAVVSGKESVSFKKEISAIFKGQNGMLYGETDDYWFAANGRNIVKLEKFENETSFKGNTQEEFEMFLMYPKLGKPFSTEFSKTKPYSVEFEKQHEVVQMKAHYKSKEFKDIELVAISKLYANGILEHYYELINCSQQVINDIWLNDSLFYEMYRAVLPYDGKFIEIKDSYYNSLDYWDSNKIDENWIFSKSHKISKGICWGKNSKLVFDNWYMRIENNLGVIHAGESKRTDSLYWTLGAFSDWREFRAFALSDEDTEKLILTDHLEFVVNDKNPFVENSIKAQVLEHKKSYFNGEIELSSVNNLFEKSKKTFNGEENANSTEFTMDIETEAKTDLLKLKVDFMETEYQKQKTVFIKDNSKIVTEIEKECDMDVHMVDNGSIRIKSAAAFSNSIFSMTYKGNEWIDSSFPNAIPKSWFNPWAGGIEIRPSKFMPSTAAQETKQVEFVELQDNVGNLWKGIKNSMRVQKNKTYKGLSINQYFLLLPGTDVMCYTTEYVQEAGKHISNLDTYNFSFLKTGDDITKGYYKLTNEDGEKAKFKCGKVRQDIKTSTYIQYGSSERKDTLSVITDAKDGLHIAFANNAITASLIIGRLTAKNNSRLFTKPVFYVFGENELDYESLGDLLKLRFD